MKLRPLAAAAMLLASSLAAVPSYAITYRYSWYSGGTGPFFATPAEVCIWARSVFPADYPRGQTLALGEDGFCREAYGLGPLYIMPYAQRMPSTIELIGRSTTKSLPAGPVLPLTARVTQEGTPTPDATVTIQMNGAQITGTTNAAGTFAFSYTPPFQSAATDTITATCDQCENTARKTIVADPVAQSCPAFGNPVEPATGAKVQHDTDWTDEASHPLSVSRTYNSQARNGSWTHNWSAVVLAADLDAGVSIAGEQELFSRELPTDPWKSQRGANTLTQTAAGFSYLRAQDESTWRFDNAGQLLDITARNGWWYLFTRDAQGRLTSVTNAFGRKLVFSYSAAGNLARISLPDGGALNYGFDGLNRLTAVTYPDATTRGYRYEDARFPTALTGIDDERGIRLASFAYDESGRALSTQHAGGAGFFSLTYAQGGSSHGTLGGGGEVDPGYYRVKTRMRTPAGGYQDMTWVGGDGTITFIGASGPADGIGLANRATASGLPASDTDFLGYLTNYQWDTQRELLLSSTRAAGRPEASTTRTQWHPTFRLPVRVEEGGQEVAQIGLAARATDYTYDARGNLLSRIVSSVKTGESRRTAWTYNAQGLIDTMTDASGGTWRYGWDAAGNTASITDPLGTVTRQTFDAAGRLLTRIEPDGLISTWAYDTRGRVLAQSAGGETTRFSYTPAGQLASAILPNGYSVSYTYDAAQRLISAADNRNNSVAYTLDAAGNRVREEVKDASGAIAQVTSRVIDSLNRVTAVLDSTGRATQIGYDANGEPISQTDPLNQTTRQALDGLRRPTTTTLPDGATASMAWGQLDQLAQATDPKGVATRYTYNAFDEVVTETSPDIGTIRYTRNAAGDVTSIQDAKGQIASITRDALGRPAEISYATNHITHFSYDAAGAVSRIEDNSGSTAYTRDPQGRVTSKTQRVNDNVANPSQYKAEYMYANGDLAAITYPSGLNVFYKRAAGRITGVDVQEPGGTAKKPRPVIAFISNLSYTALGQPKAWNWSNGDAAARTFDADGRMTASEFASYTYDAASRITGITQSLYAQGTGTVYTIPLTFTAGYDARDRLISFARDGAETRYTYDANSNRLTALDKVTSDTDLDGEFDDADFAKATSQALNIGDGSNKLLGFTQTVIKTNAGKTRSTVVTPVNYTLDANGALTSDGLRTFEYDASNRLAKVKLTNNGEAASVSYMHNAMGQRVFKSEYEAGQTLPNEAELGEGFVAWLKKSFGWLFAKAQANASIGTAYVSGDGEIPRYAILGEYGNGSATGAGRTEYIWLPTESGQVIPVGLYRNGKFFAIHSDHLGTPRLMTDEAKAVVWQWPYSAFGNNKPTGILKATDKARQAMTNQPVLLRATAPVVMNVRMPGQYFDVETGMHQNYFRHYDPKTGRYVQGDPIGMDGGWNRHGYVSGKPLGYADPYGLWPTADDIGFFTPEKAASAAQYWASRQAQTGNIAYAIPGMAAALAAEHYESTLNAICSIRGGGKLNFLKSTIPRDPKTGNFLPLPEAVGPHTTLGTRDGRNGPYRQGATFDENGKFKGVTDVTNHNRSDHTNPHWHPAAGPNSTVRGGAPIP